MAVIAIWIGLFLITAFGPLRLSLVAFLCLSVVDFEGGLSSIASFNVLKGLLLPAYLLWRLRRYAGHPSLPVAPMAWLLLVFYVGIAGAWSWFPDSAHKLVIQMIGSFMIVCVYMRGTKGGFLDPKSALAAAAGCLVLGAIRSALYPDWGDNPARFTGFTSAQAYAALLAAFYCTVLCGKGLRTPTRVIGCSVIAGAIVMDGSRIWFLGIVVATLFSLMLSRGQVWLKICAFAGIVGLVTILVGASDLVFKYVAIGATTNRIAAAASALHRGDTQATGLGTYNFRRGINDMAIERIKQSTPSELLFGRGTCNGAVITATLSAGYSHFPDPNRMFHNEWLRVIYEWGLIGSAMWLLMIGATIWYAIQGVRIDPRGNAKPLLVYLPVFMIGLAGENFIAGAGQASNMGFIFVVALSTVPHREFTAWRSSRAARKLAQKIQVSPGLPPIPAWRGTFRTRSSHLV